MLKQERREEDLDADDDERRREHGEALLGELAESAIDPGGHDHQADDEPGEQRDATEQQAVLEPEARPHAVEPRILLVHEVRAVGVRAEPERHHLGPDDHQQRAGDHGVQLPLAAEHVDLQQRDERDDRPDDEQQRAGQHEQVRGAVHEQEAQVAPAVLEARQLALAAARVVLDRELADVEVLLRRPDDHLRRELHPGRPQVQARQHVAPDAAHPAVRVADARAEEDVEHARQHRVPDVAVQPGHRAGVDVVHPVAHHELGAVLELLDEARDLLEVVRQVGVAHDDVAAARGGEAGEVRAAVAAARLVHHAGAGAGGELGRPVLGRVVGDHHLTRDPGGGEGTERSRDAALDVRLLVEARDDDRYDELLVRR